MKKLGGLLLISGLVLAGLLPIPRSYAAACANASTYGAVLLDVPELPKTGDYSLWVRLQSPETTGKMLLEVNQTTCIDISSTTLVPNTWTWVASTTHHNFSDIDNNTVKVIGIQAGIKFDRVLLTKPGCKPENFGNNCSAGIEAEQTSNGIQQLPPPSDEPVQGEVILSNTPFSKAGKLKRLTYSAAGRTVQSSAIATPFDTTRLENGKYTVFIETTLTDGKVIRESTVITIENEEKVLSPAMRWVWRYESTLRSVGMSVGLAILVLALLGLVRRWYLRRRERHFHGF